jgi:hypothetical protein
LPWFEELVSRIATLPTHQVGTGMGSMEYIGGPIQYSYYYNRHNEPEAREWATEAEAALAAVFPENHPNRRSWDKVINSDEHIGELMDKLIGIFKGAVNQVRNGRIGSLIDAIRVESESDLLDQAEQLLAGGYFAAAAVIAGGTLETHLKSYCQTHGIPVTGEGSISKYNGAVGQARKTTANLYDANDGKRVEAWGGTRNEAAHNPGGFKHTKEEILRYIEGIREFLSRVN